MKDDFKPDLQLMATVQLQGSGTATQAQTYGFLIDALRSDEPLSQSLRESLAAALEAAQTGQGLVRLRLEAQEGYFKSLSTITANKRLLKAGHFLETEKAKGRSYQSLHDELSDRFGVEDAATYSRRARAFYKSYIAFLASDHPALDLARQMAGNYSLIEDADARAYTFSKFSELNSGFEYPPLEGAQPLGDT